MFILLFLTAMVLSGIAAYYSVIGLVAIFSAAAIPVAIMGGSLEVAKLVVASWLYRYWRAIPLLMKTYFTTALLVLMLITSMGIFGFLSKAHSDQSLVSGDVLAQIAVYDEKIKTAKENIDANRRALKQLDEAVDQVMGRSTTEAGADKAVAIRRSQQAERRRLLAEIETEQKKISQLNEARAPIAAEVRKVEAEVGPLKYIAALIYGDNPDGNLLERAVRWLIILLIVVFDPLAVLMLIAANLTQMRQAEWQEPPKEEKPDDKTNKDVANTTELQVADTPAEQPQASTSDATKIESHIVDPAPVETVGVEADPEPKKKIRRAKKSKPEIVADDPVATSDNTNNIEQPIIEPIIEQTPQDKSLSETKPVKPDFDTEIQKMIDADDNEGLEAVYKKIVKELAKKNRAKSTHWGPIKNRNG